MHRRRHGRRRPVRGRALTARPRATAAKATTHILRASWKPRIYRDIEIDSGASLRQLAEAAVAAFDFDFDHAFGFYDTLGDAWPSSKEKYELFADMEDGDSDAGSVERTAVSAAFPTVGKKLMFLFDYGDEWRFTIELVKHGEKKPRTRYPRLLTATGEAPVQYPNAEDE